MAAVDLVVPEGAGQVRGGVRLVLRAEAVVVLVLAVLCYRRAGGGWGLFALLFLVPDLTFAAYAAGARIGALAYNVLHSYVGALMLVALGVTVLPGARLFGLIWVAHIGWDRAIGYGLKYVDGFGVTHLGLVGRAGRVR